jgi:hypothetical protein
MLVNIEVRYYHEFDVLHFCERVLFSKPNSGNTKLPWSISYFNLIIFAIIELINEKHKH